MTFTATSPTETFSTGQVVKGIVCGTFEILGFRVIDGETFAQLKEICNGKRMRGELALPITKIKG